MEKWKFEDRDVLRKHKVGQFIKIIENAERLEKFEIDLYYKVINIDSKIYPCHNMNE